MSELEATQVSIGIVEPTYRFEHPETGETITGKAIHDQMRTNRVIRKDSEGAEYTIIQFNQREFPFRMPVKGLQRRTHTVGKSVADALIAGSVIAVGKLSDALSRPMVPYLEVISSHQLGVEDAPQAARSVTKCPIPGCDKELGTLPRLARHLETHKKTHPEFFKSDNEVALEETEREANEADKS